MDLGGPFATIYAPPIIPPEYYIALPAPCIGLKIFFPVIITTTFT
jgi:hypothetical protein